jgi:hypothetical protein
MEKWYEDERKANRQLDFETQSAIAKCLHPDQRANATDAQKDDAFKLFTAWKAYRARVAS